MATGEENPGSPPFEEPVDPLGPPMNEWENMDEPAKKVRIKDLVAIIRTMLRLVAMC